MDSVPLGRLRKCRSSGTQGLDGSWVGRGRGVGKMGKETVIYNPFCEIGIKNQTDLGSPYGEGACTSTELLLQLPSEPRLGQRSVMLLEAAASLYWRG